MSILVSTLGCFIVALLVWLLVGAPPPGPSFGTRNDPLIDPRWPWMEPPWKEFPRLPWKLPLREPWSEPLFVLKEGGLTIPPPTPTVYAGEREGNLLRHHNIKGKVCANYSQLFHPNGDFVVHASGHPMCSQYVPTEDLHVHIFYMYVLL